MTVIGLRLRRFGAEAVLAGGMRELRETPSPAPSAWEAIQGRNWQAAGR
jgi:hypothetical protein